MNARQRRKNSKNSAAALSLPEALARLEAKTDLILERCDDMERHSAKVGAAAGGIAGAVAGGVMAVIVVYAKSLLGAR